MSNFVNKTNIISVLYKPMGVTQYIITGMVFVLIFGVYCYIQTRTEYGFINDEKIVFKKLEIDDLKLNIQGKAFYIYKTDIMGTKLLYLYGIMDKTLIPSLKKFHHVESTDIMIPVIVNDVIPTEFLHRLEIEKSTHSGYLKGSVIDLEHNDNKKQIRLKIKKETGAFVLIYRTPGRSD